jgi:tetratricopeptide (TPR) repeat protein
MDRIDDAVDCLHEALKHNPQFEDARLALARIYQKRGDYDTALKELEGIVARDPEFWRAHVQQAQLLTTRGDYRAAVEACKKVLKSKPDNANIHNLLGRCYMELGEYELALKEYSLALELDPKTLLAKRGTVGVYMKQGRLAEARKLLITMTKGGQSLGLVHRLLAEVLMKEEKYSEAVAEFNAAILHGKKLVEKHPELLTITPVKGDDKKTAESYKEAFEKISMDTTEEDSERPD